MHKEIRTLTKSTLSLFVAISTCIITLCSTPLERVYADSNTTIQDGNTEVEDTTADKKVEVGVNNYPYIDVLVTRGISNLDTSNVKADLLKELSDKGIPQDHINIISQDTNQLLSTGSFNWTGWSAITGRYGSQGNESSAGNPLSNHRAGTIKIGTNNYSNGQNSSSNVNFVGNWVDDGFMLLTAPILAEDPKYTVYNQNILFNYSLSFGDSITGAGIIVDGYYQGDYFYGYAISINNTSHNHKSGNSWCSRQLVNIANGHSQWDRNCYTAGKPDKTGAIFKVKYYTGGMSYSSNSNGLTIRSRHSGVNSSNLHGQYTLVKSFALPQNGRMKVDVTNDKITVYVSDDTTIKSDYQSDIDYESKRVYAYLADCTVDKVGSYFGFFSEHYQHGCTSLGNFDLKQLKIDKKARIDYSTVLNTSGIFNENSLHTVINIDDVSCDSFTDKEKLMSTINASNGTDGKNIHFMHWGTNDNYSEITNFINKLSFNERRGIFLYNNNYGNCIIKSAEYIRDLFLQNCNKNTVVKENPAELTVTPSEMRYNSAEGTGKFKYGKWTVKHYSKAYTGDDLVNSQMYDKTFIEADVDSNGNIIPHEERISKYNTKGEERKYITTKYRQVDINSDDDPTNDVITGTHIKGEKPGEERDIAYYYKQDNFSSMDDLEYVGNAIVLRSVGYDSYNTSFNESPVSYKICRAYNLTNAVYDNTPIHVIGHGFNIDDSGTFNSTVSGDLTTIETDYDVIDVDGNNLGVTQQTHMYVILSEDWSAAPFKAGRFVIDTDMDYSSGYSIYKEVPIYVCKNYFCTPVYKDTIVNEYDPVIQDVAYEAEETATLYYDNNLNMEYFDDEVGLYEIYYEDELLKTVLEHRRPHAEFAVTIGALDPATGYKNVIYTNKSYDLDNYFTVSKAAGENMPGIETCTWQYMCENDMVWHSGRPDKIDADLQYVVKLIVTDPYGESVSTTKIIGGNTTPPIADFTLIGDDIVVDKSGTKSISIYGDMSINDMSYDPNGLELTNYYWTVSYRKNANSVPVILCQNQSTPILTFNSGPGAYTYQLQVKNSKNKLSNIHMETIEVTADNVAPDIHVTPLWCDWGDYCDINVAVTDADSGFDYFIYSFSEDKNTPTDNSYSDEGGTTGVWSSKITNSNSTIRIDKDGKWYLHIKAYDKAGNEAIYKTVSGDPAGIYLIDTTKPTIEKVTINPHNLYADFTFKTNDYSTLYKKEGSGVTYYAINQDKSAEPIDWYVNPTYVRVYKSGIYYVWIKDLKGNVSLPYEVRVSKYILDYKYNYIGNTKSFMVSSEIFYNDKFTTAGTPNRNLYTFMGWNSNKLGTGIDIPASTEYTLDDSFLTNELNSKNLIGDITTPTIPLYAHWKRTLKLTFNMNSGQYKGSSDEVILEGTIYNDQPSYTFNIVGGLTADNWPYYDKQVNKLDCYSTYDDNGINKDFRKVNNDGNEYRLLGWSTSSLAKVPDDGLWVFDDGSTPYPKHKETYEIKSNTTLYAVWEPILTVNASLNRTLGNLNYSDGSSPVTRINNITADSGTQILSTIIKPGEQGNYDLLLSGTDKMYSYVVFDNKITDIYNNVGPWTDNLNPPTDENLESGQPHGLNRRITIDGSKRIYRKFYMPQYIGTQSAPDSSKGITEYNVLIEVVQESKYYERVKSSSEQVEILGIIHIITTPPEEPDPPVLPPQIVSVLDELKAKLKIKLR